MIDYKVTHYYQPTNHSCTPTSTSMLLSHYGIVRAPEQIMQEVPIRKHEDGTEFGSVPQDLARYCLQFGLKVTYYSFDCFVTDYTWQKLSATDTLKRLEAVRDSRDIACLSGKDISRAYVDAYIEFIRAGGALKVRPFVTTKLLDQLLQKGPLVTNVCSPVFYLSGRNKNPSLRTSVPDDKDGRITNHTIAVVGKNSKGQYRIADPWKKPGFLWRDPEHLLASITAAQIECDNGLFYLRK